MTDPSRILDDVFADLGSGDALPLPTLPASLPASASSQRTDIAITSRTSHTSRIRNEPVRETKDGKPKNIVFSDAGARASSSYGGGVGSAGSAGSGAKTLAGSTPPPFPQDLEDAGSAGREGTACERPILDLNAAAPQRSDWWTGFAMAEVDALVAPAGEPLPISPAEVKAGVERELRHLASFGITGPEAERRAVAITRAKVGNSPALAVRQTNTGHCAVCDGPLREAEVAIAVLNPGAAPLHLHAACHDTYRARRRALVSRIMAAAGYGTEAEGEAA